MPHDRKGRLVEVGDHIKFNHSERYDYARQAWDTRPTIGRVTTVMPGSESCNVQVVHLLPGYWPIKPETLTAKDTELVLKADGSEPADAEAPHGRFESGALAGMPIPAPAADAGFGRLGAIVATMFLALVALTGAAFAQDPQPSPSPALAANAGRVTVTATMGGLVTMGADVAVTPEAFVEVDGPLPLGSSVPARVYTRLGITSEPGQAVNLADVATFKAAEISLGLYRVIGVHEADGQTVTLSIAGEWGASSRLTSGDTQPVERLARHYGVGLRVAEKRSGAGLTLLYGSDEGTGSGGMPFTFDASGQRRFGAWILYGSVPVIGKDGLITLTGDATLVAGPKRAGARDVLRLGVVLDVGAALARATK
jgi:hypothetical protein